jgi:hypothetical protein
MLYYGQGDNLISDVNVQCGQGNISDTVYSGYRVFDSNNNLVGSPSAPTGLTPLGTSLPIPAGANLRPSESGTQWRVVIDLYVNLQSPTHTQDPENGSSTPQKLSECAITVGQKTTGV